MTNQEILETLEGIQQLLSWQTQLVGNVVDHLRQQQADAIDGPGGEGPRRSQGADRSTR